MGSGRGGCRVGSTPGVESVNRRKERRTERSSVTTNTTLFVTKATPTISSNPTASPIKKGVKISSSKLTGGLATLGGSQVQGSFDWVNRNLVFTSAGTTSAPVQFKPNNAGNFNTVTSSINIMITN